MSEWMSIETAPKDGSAFQARIPGNGEDNVLCWQDGLLDSNEQACGAWCFASDQEPPDCWTDGWCREVNEDGVASVKPTVWLMVTAGGFYPIQPSTRCKPEDHGFLNDHVIRIEDIDGKVLWSRSVQ